MLALRRWGRVSVLALLCCASAGSGAQVAAEVAARVAAPPPASAPLAGMQAPAFDLETDVTRAMRTFDIPGVAIAIVKDGKVVVTRGFGVLRAGEDRAVDVKTLFPIASNSKGFTAAALAMLVDEGKIGWDDPVTRHLPDFQMYDPYVTREMTVRDLLVHRSGLGLGAGDMMWWPTSSFTADEIIHRLRYIRPATSFRSTYAYDNLLYIVAAKIIAVKSGKPWGQFIRQRIFTPLAMSASTTSVDEGRGNDNQASAHSDAMGKASIVRPIPTENAAGAVGINTNAEDIARWMTALLGGGAIPGGQGRLFSAAQARELWTAQTPMAIREPAVAMAGTRPNFLAYGLGFQLRDYRGLKLVQHGGALKGFYSRVVMVPEARLGIAILTNAENSGVLESLGLRLLDQYLGLAPTDWITLVGNAERQRLARSAAAQKSAMTARAARSRPSLPLTSYDGEYTDAWYGSVTITPAGGKRIMRFARTPDLTGELEHFQHDTFIVRWNERHLNADAYVTFSLNPDGSIERMKMAPISSETDFSYDFADLLFTPAAKAR